MFQRPILTIKKVITANLLFVIFIAIFSAFLVVRALPENHMDMISAQTLLSARWWARDGFLKQYFLALPSGYGKIVKYFDEPELNEHAHTNAGGLIGHRLYYTHYPSFYIVPIAILIKFGITKLFILRIVSIIASILGIVFLYSFIKLISNKYIAFIGALYFVISPIFIKWSDSLEYIPQEDMWRFLILFMSTLVFQKFNSETLVINYYKTKLFLTAIWAAYFFLALTSINSTFFIATWLTGLTAVYIYNSHYLHKIRLFLFLTAFWALAPILGFTFQLLQNTAYLGWSNAWLDIYGAFIYAGNRPDLGFLVRIAALIKPFFSMTGLYNFYSFLVPLGISKIKLLILSTSPILILITIVAIIRLKKITEYKLYHLPILITLAVAPLTQTFLMPLLGFRDNLGRLFAPFVGIFIGTVVYMLFLLIKNKIKIMTLFDKITFSFLAFAVLSLFIIQIILNNTIRFWPTYASISNSDIVFTKAIQKISTGEKAVFMINAADTQIPQEELKKRLATYNPIFYQGNYSVWEYYFDMPLLNFTKTSYLIRDLLFLEKRSEYPFTAIVTSDDKKVINELHQKLADKNLLISTVKSLENRYFFTLSPNPAEN